MSGSLCRRPLFQRRPPCESLESRVLLATTTLTPVADAYVRDGGSAAANFGSDPALVVKGSTTPGNTRRTYVKFDISSLSEADTVTLRLFGSASASAPAVSLAAHGVGDIGWARGRSTGTTSRRRRVALDPQHFRHDGHDVRVERHEPRAGGDRRRR